AVLSIKISNVPTDAAFNHGTNNHDGSWTLTPVDLTGLTVTPGSSTDSFTLTVTATTMETGNGAQASTTGTVSVNVTPVADAPTLDVDTTKSGLQSSVTVSGNEDSAITLNIASALTESVAVDPDAALSIKISNVPTDAAFNHGTNNHDGSWTLTPVDLTGLTVTPGSSTDSFTLTVTATTTESGNGAQASTAGTVAVNVTPVPGSPVLAATDATAASSSV